MNFLQLQDEVLSNRFDQSQRPQVKNWINYRYGRLWALEDWTFKQQITTLNVSSGQNSIALGTIGDIQRIWDTTVAPSYAPMLPMRAEDLWDTARATQSGAPYNYTIVGSNIYFERPMDQARSFYVLSTIPFTALVDDTDTPLVPAEFHEVIVAGASSHGLRLEDDPAWQAFEEDWNQGITDMKAAYLTSLQTAWDVYPDWP